MDEQRRQGAVHKDGGGNNGNGKEGQRAHIRLAHGNSNAAGKETQPENEFEFRKIGKVGNEFETSFIFAQINEDFSTIQGEIKTIKYQMEMESKNTEKKEKLEKTLEEMKEMIENELQKKKEISSINESHSTKEIDII